MPDAIVLLKNDHKAVKRLFRQFEKLGDEAFAQRRTIVDQIITELSVHAVVEEQVFYPTVRKSVPDVDDTILEALEEHHVVKWTLNELRDLDAGDERFKAKVTVLIESVEHHIEEEEGELFPTVREHMGRKDLQDLGASLEDAKASAPTEPLPLAPDEPPGGEPATPQQIATMVEKAPTPPTSAKAPAKKPGLFRKR